MMPVRLPSGSGRDLWFDAKMLLNRAHHRADFILGPPKRKVRSKTEAQ
jgi:hypothetical protein